MRTIVGFFIFLLLFQFGTRAGNSQCSQGSSGFVHGRVVALDGTPISEAQLILRMRDLDKTLTASSDANGCYEFKDKFEGYFTLTAQLAGFRIEKTDTSIFGGDMKAIDFGLEVGQFSDWPSILITGKVQAGKSAVKFARVEIISVYNDKVSARVVADEHGRFKLKIRNPGAYIIYGLGEKGVAIKPLLIKGSNRDQILKVDLNITHW